MGRKVLICRHFLFLRHSGRPPDTRVFPGPQNTITKKLLLGGALYSSAPMLIFPCSEIVTSCLSARFPSSQSFTQDWVTYISKMAAPCVVHSVGTILLDPGHPLPARFRALFTLRNLGGAEAVELIGRGFGDESALLKHELAYCLGQMRDPRAIPVLSAVLRDPGQEPMVRHEAGEALGAIADPEVLALLKEYSQDPVIEVAETCQIAVRRIEWLQQNPGAPDNNPYLSVDPAPPAEGANISALRATLLDDSCALFERYRAMFALRNIGGREAVLALTDGLQFGSSLFRHEIGYVLGQMQHEAAIPGLAAALERFEENPMVRHECAEALGSIAQEECFKVLQAHMSDEEPVVRESCEVALDMYAYENSNAFQYADGLDQIQKCT
uniref:Deoxyhypusine hydroxylase n=1 Tax=Leptobrachium leishanense TaxID=445787 RepID=A0A8C5LSJ1_9ANUR